jgi:hypothetical protein
MYLVSKGYKFSGLDVANYDQTCLNLKKTLLPLEQMDTNAAYQLATQWLASASMDVEQLNRDCQVQVAVSPHWNGLSKLGQMPGKEFVPIYYVWWTLPEKDAPKIGGITFASIARVELFLPTKKLIQMSVDDPKYILRRPLTFTNLNSLFPGTGRVFVFTNKPGPVYHPGPSGP